AVYADAAFEGTRHSYLFDLRAIRLWDRVLVTCRVYGDADLLHDQLVLSELAGDAGSFRWDSLTGHMVWSPGLYRLLGREQREGPMSISQLGDLVDPADLARLALEIDDTLAKGRTLKAEVTGAGPVAGRRFGLSVEPRLEQEALAGVAGTVRDLAAEERAKPGRGSAGSARRRPDTRLGELAARDGRLEADGFHVSGLVAGPENPVLDCWFDTVELPDGRVLIVVGEAHGPDSALTGQRLRHAAIAYALAGLTPGALLTALNALSTRLDPGRTAAVTVAVVDGKGGTVGWAAAGQGALIRCPSGGAGQVVPGALGLPIGSADGLGYTDNEAAMSVGDRLVLYTSGLLDGGVVSPAEALRALLSCEHPDPQGILGELRERAVTGAEAALSLVAGTITGLSGRRARTR
ncbi:MAG TPA: PP2C family protein-serine/threonine phosphatase, partial [Phytomonospora sp.]